jgi:hypothetical protein
MATRCSYKQDVRQTNSKEKNMILTKIFLPGEFEDAFIYMGRLIIITAEKSIRILNFDHIVEKLLLTHPNSHSVLNLAFSRNDWLSNNQFRSLMKDDEIREAVLSKFSLLSQHDRLEIDDVEDCVQLEQDLNIPGYVILDMLLYYKRMYIAADTGLYHIDFDWGNDYVLIEGSPVKKFDARCITTSAKYGSINTSCGDEGLFSAIDDFGWSHLTFNRNMKKVANKSIRSLWSNYDLVNYSSPTSLSLLKSTVEKQTIDSSAFEKALLTEIGTESIDLEYILESINIDTGNDLDTIQFVYNSANTIFVHTTEGTFYSIGIRKVSDDRPKVSFTRTYKGRDTQVLSMNSCSSGMIVETNNTVWLFSNREWFPIVESEVLSVRTFLRSKRYKNLVLITNEEGLFITSVFDPKI